jgi:hypothetical protein
MTQVCLKQSLSFEVQFKVYRVRVYSRYIVHTFHSAHYDKKSCVIYTTGYIDGLDI